MIFTILGVNMIHYFDSITVNISIIIRLDDFLRIAGTLRNMPDLWVGSALNQDMRKCSQKSVLVGIDSSFFFIKKKEDLDPCLSWLFKGRSRVYLTSKACKVAIF